MKGQIRAEWILLYNTPGTVNARHIGNITVVIGKGIGKSGGRISHDRCSNYNGSWQWWLYQLWCLIVFSVRHYRQRLPLLITAFEVWVVFLVSSSCGHTAPSFGYSDNRGISEGAEENRHHLYPRQLANPWTSL